MQRLAAICLTLALGLSCIQIQAKPIDRHALISQFSPQIIQPDATHLLKAPSPFSIGNGRFAFTADVTGLQSVGSAYFAAGFPLETKARWAWHSKAGKQYSLSDANETYNTYNRKVQFPTQMDSPAAQWLRRNPHDLPLGRIVLLLDGKPIELKQINNIHQRLDLWRGTLTSKYTLASHPVQVESAAHTERDALGFRIVSPLNKTERLSIQFQFPRAYDFAIKNTPDMDFTRDREHHTHIQQQTKNTLILNREVDDLTFTIAIHWQGKANIEQRSAHVFELIAAKQQKFEFTVEYMQQNAPRKTSLTTKKIIQSAQKFWPVYWQAGAFVDLSQSSNPHAQELQRRILLSQYLLATQARDTIPTQETGLTSSSWYGKFHTEMAWWHYAHWIAWNRSDAAQPMLDWYLKNLPQARLLAKERGLQGARWPKMVGTDGRESPGGNALIIWNQPQPIHLVEMLYQKNPTPSVLKKYSTLVEETAEAMSSMLVWEPQENRFVLNPPIWIAQEIYSPAQSRNPTFELAYWRYGLETAQRWRTRLGKPINQQWQTQLEKLAQLPQKDDRYVAIESIPDTFDNPASREDHPSMLAPTAFWNDAQIDKKIMRNTLDAVINHWQFDTKIWGWDYPMLAMTAAHLGRAEQAVELLLMESKNNRYLMNGHCPQIGADVPAYLPANAALLMAVATLLEKDAEGNHIGFPTNKGWKIHTEGF